MQRALRGVATGCCSVPISPLSQVAELLSSGRLGTVAVRPAPTRHFTAQPAQKRTGAAITSAASVDTKRHAIEDLRIASVSGSNVLQLLRKYNRAGLMDSELLAAARPHVVQQLQGFTLNDIADLCACYAHRPASRGRHAASRGSHIEESTLRALADRASSLCLGPGSALEWDGLVSLSFLASALGRSGVSLPGFFAALCAKVAPAVPSMPQSVDGSLCAMRLAVAVMRQVPAGSAQAAPLWAALREYAGKGVKDMQGLVEAGKGPSAVYGFSMRYKSLLAVSWSCAISEAWPGPLPLTTATVHLANSIAQARIKLELETKDVGRLAALEMAHVAAEQRGMAAPGSCPRLSPGLRHRVETWRDGLAAVARPSIFQSKLADAIQGACGSLGLPPPRKEVCLSDGLLVDFAWSLPRATAVGRHGKARASQADQAVRGVVIEVDGPDHFIKAQEGQSARQLDGPTCFKFWLLESIGYEVIHVPVQDVAGSGQTVQAYIEGRLRSSTLGRYVGSVV